MSNSLRRALDVNYEEYVQNPVDDLHSFSWTGVWATVHNRRALDGADHKCSQEIRRWRLELSGEGRLMVRDSLKSPMTRQYRHAPLVQGMSVLLEKWIPSLDALEAQFALAWQAPSTTADQKLNMFYRFALEGVANFAELLYEVREQLSGFPQSVVDGM